VAVYFYRYYGLRIAYAKFTEKPEDIPKVSRAYYDLCFNQTDDPSFKKRPLWRTAVDLNMQDDELYHSFNGTARANINRGRKDGITTKINSDYANAIEFARRFYKVKRLQLLEPALQLLLKDSNETEFKSKSGILVNAYHKGMMIQGLYFLIGKDRMAPEMVSAYRAFDNSYDRLCSEAVRLCYFDGMCYARDNGIKKEINTIGSDINNPDSIGKFKLGFGGVVFQDYNYVKDFNPILKVLDKLGIRRF